VDQWRAMSRKLHAPGVDQVKDSLAILTGRVEEADAKIREAAKPRLLHCELTPDQ
jgi:hypothetical protein